MNKIPRWAKILLVLLILIVVVALAAPYFLDVDRYRGLILSAVEKETGRKAAIGSIRARFLPTVGITVESFVLGNPPGFASGELVNIETIYAGLSLSSLLRREIQLHSIEFVRPKITLLTDERGRTNYDFSSAGKAPEKAGEKKDSSTFRIASIPNITLTDVEFLLGTVRSRDAKVTPTIRVSEINAEVGNVAFDEKLLKQWTAAADLSGIKLEMDGIAGTSSISSGELKLSDGALNAQFDGSLGASTKVKGKLNVADITKALVVFDLSTPLLDLDKLFPPGPATASTAAPFTGKSELIAQGKIVANTMRYSGYEATNARGDMKVYSDRVELSPASMTAYGGTLTGSLRMDKRSAPPRISLNAQARNVDVARLISSVSGQPSKVTGSGELNLRASTVSGPRLMDALTGTGDFAVRNGKVVGFNLGALQALGKLQQIISFGQAGSGAASADTTFSLLNGDLNIGGGRVASNRIHLDSNLGTADMRGSFGFDQTLNYDGRANISTASTGSGGSNNPAAVLGGILGTVTKQPIANMSVPFSLRGTFKDPKFAPGRGVPTFTPLGSKEETAQPEKKKGILDLFRKP